MLKLFWRSKKIFLGLFLRAYHFLLIFVREGEPGRGRERERDREREKTDRERKSKHRQKIANKKFNSLFQ